MLGTFHACYVGHASDHDIRYNSASGGLATSLLIYALEKKVIDGALVLGMSESNPLETKPFIATNASEVVSANGSKYCPSASNTELHRILCEGGSFAVVGLPCHIHKEYVPTASDCRLLLWLERTVAPAWGVQSGRVGRTARCIVDPGGPKEIVLKKANHFPIAPNTVVRCYTAGGGGYGPPWERPIEAVLEDVQDGYVSRAGAKQDFGLRFVDGTMTVDEPATKAAPGRLWQKRIVKNVRDFYQICMNQLLRDYNNCRVHLNGSGKLPARKQ